MPNSRGGLVKFVEILEKGGLFLRHTFLNVEANKVKWVAKLVQKGNLMGPYNNSPESNTNTKYFYRYQLFNFAETSRK